jgi:predicted metal-dependent phosphoesterase TrpH
MEVLNAMIEITLSNRELQLFNEIFAKSDQKIHFDLLNLCVRINNNEKETLEYLIDQIMDYFIQHGLKKNSEPNALGMELEKLNTKFINQLQILNDSLMRV